MTKYVLPLLLLGVSVPSHAIVFTGNQRLSFWVDRSAGDLTDGSVYLNKIRVHKCDNTHVDYPVNASLDPVAGSSIVIAGGDLCGATWYWGSTMTLHGDNGNDFTIDYDDNTTHNVFASPLVATPLTPYEVTEGSISGTGPKLLLDFHFEI